MGRPLGSKNKPRQIVELHADVADGVTTDGTTSTDDFDKKTQRVGRPRKRRTVFNPGKPPNEDVHDAIIGVFGIVNELLEKAGHYDLMESEVNLIFIPAERILARHNKLGVGGKISPDALDIIQISIGLGSYGVRISPSVKRAIVTRYGRKQSAGTTGAGSGGTGGSTASQDIPTPEATVPPIEHEQSAIERYFAHVGSESAATSGSSGIDNGPLPSK
jgi:hypothetical protein